MNRNRRQTAIQNKALLVLTLIAAGEGNQPVVKKALRSMLSQLERISDDADCMDFEDLQHVDVIPFQRFQQERMSRNAKQESSPLKRFVSSDKNDAFILDFPETDRFPKLCVYKE